MALNFVRGFRRIGWVVTLPIAAIIVLAFYESAKVFSSSNYEVEKTEEGPRTKYAAVVELPNSLGIALFSKEVPKEIADRIVADYAAKEVRELAGLNAKRTDTRFIIGADPAARYDFTVHKEVSTLRLSGLIAASFALAALVIQGSISILAWVLRGFRG